MADAARRLRLDAGRGILLLAGAHDPLGARLVERAGFGAVWASGLEISTSRGVPDEGLLSFEERLSAARAMACAVAIPVVADCDSGFGGPGAAARLVREYGEAGVAGVCIEDARVPKRNSFAPGAHPLVAPGLFARKIRAAVQARRGRTPLVLARIEALVAGLGVGEALLRARAYEAAGADALVIHSRSPDPGEVLAFVRAWDGRAPLVLIPTTYFRISMAALERSGKVGAVIYANQGMRASVAAMGRAFRRILQDRGTGGIEPWIASVDDLFRLQVRRGR